MKSFELTTISKIINTIERDRKYVKKIRIQFLRRARSANFVGIDWIFEYRNKEKLSKIDIHLYNPARIS